MLDQHGPSWPQVGPCWPKLVPSWPQVNPQMTPSWPMLGQVGPSWPLLAPISPQVGPCWLMLAPSWAHDGQSPKVPPRIAKASTRALPPRSGCSKMFTKALPHLAWSCFCQGVHEGSASEVWVFQSVHKGSASPCFVLFL